MKKNPPLTKMYHDDSGFKDLTNAGGHRSLFDVIIVLGVCVRRELEPFEGQSVIKHGWKSSLESHD